MELHAFTQGADEGDADEVKGSDAVYEFVGKNPRATEGGGATFEATAARRGRGPPKGVQGGTRRGPPARPGRC